MHFFLQNPSPMFISVGLHRKPQQIRKIWILCIICNFLYIKRMIYYYFLQQNGRNWLIFLFKAKLLDVANSLIKPRRRWTSPIVRSVKIKGAPALSFQVFNTQNCQLYDTHIVCSIFFPVAIILWYSWLVTVNFWLAGIFSIHKVT